MNSRERLLSGSAPTRHHLDKRAEEIAALEADQSDDALLSTQSVAEWLGVSVQFLEIGRCRNYGPPFVRVSPRMIRYRRGDVVAWLRERKHASTAEYSKCESP